MTDPTLERLIREKIGAQRYGVYFSTGEGEFYSNGYEECSGAVVTEDGRHYAYWTGWDDDRGGIRLAMWKRTVAEPDWRNDAEYREARRDAGLADI